MRQQIADSKQQKAKGMFLLFAIYGLLFAMAFPACGPKEKVARVAVALPLTGDIAALGQGLQRGDPLAGAIASFAQMFQTLGERRFLLIPDGASFFGKPL